MRTSSPRATRAVASLAVAIGLAAACLGAPPASAAPDPVKRAVPDYDGRPDAPPTAGDVLLWVPRVVLSPAYFVSEYLLRRPLGFLITEAERADLPHFLITFFTFGGTDAGIVPTFLFDFGLGAGALPSAGFYFFWDDAIAAGHDIRLRFASGGDDWWQLDFTNRYALSDRSRLSLAFDYDRRKDHIFAGIGGEFDDDHLGRYGEDRVAGTLGWTLDLGERGALDVGVEAAHFSYFRAACCDDPSLETRLEQGYYDEPPGLHHAHGTIGPQVRLAVDTRAIRPGDESGVRAELWGNLYAGIGDDDATWLRYGAAVGGYVDMYNNRTLGLRLHTELESTVSGTIPFSELVFLGGSEPLRGFSSDRLRGDSAIALTLDYRWPIWVFLDGTLFVEVGSVFGEHLEDFDTDALRLSFGMGIRPTSREDHPFELLVAAGSEPFGDGAHITSVRVVFGTTSGF
ncbi:MAG: BamA/TamA family outer membrane protein [Deltaproteobacteria bacterium]|nr:BamA/TamA family outer membrane protein [Deltaproteobacteria bacterium]